MKMFRAVGDGVLKALCPIINLDGMIYLGNNY